jgi:hypothetical protein
MPYGREDNSFRGDEGFESFWAAFESIIKEARDAELKTYGPQHPMFEELHQINQAFDDYYQETWPRHLTMVMGRGKETINQYVATIAKYKDQITTEMLVAPENRFADNVDPVFAFLIRAMCGAEMMTPEVYDKVRRAWCGDDIPHEVGNILNIKDDQDFLRAFERAGFSSSENVKLTILRKMDIMPGLIANR